MNNYLTGIEGMRTMLNDIDVPLRNFKKNAYSTGFMAVYEKNLPVMDAIEELYNTVLDHDTLIDNMAKALVETAVEKYGSVTKRAQKEAVLLDMNMSMAIFVFPAILKYKGNSSRPLVDALLEQWKAAFPKTDLQAAEYEYIENGFHKKWCYITTAVCETFQKPDHCYELELLRNYRDEYLAKQPDGELLIHEYYNMAPSIVKHIDRCDDSGEIYKGIWEQYLSPCITLIEQGRNEECRDLYVHMVRDLQHRYFIVQA